VGFCVGLGLMMEEAVVCICCLKWGVVARIFGWTWSKMDCVGLDFLSGCFGGLKEFGAVGMRDPDGTGIRGLGGGTKGSTYIGGLLSNDLLCSMILSYWAQTNNCKGLTGIC